MVSNTFLPVNNVKVTPVLPVLCARTSCGKVEQVRQKTFKVEQEESWFLVSCRPADGSHTATGNHHLTAGHPTCGPPTSGSRWQLSLCSHCQTDQ